MREFNFIENKKSIYRSDIIFTIIQLYLIHI